MESLAGLKMNMYKILIFISFLVCSMVCAAQNVENVFGDAGDSSSIEEVIEQSVIQPDTVLIKNFRSVSADSIRALKSKKEFAYVPLMDSLLQKESSQSDKKINASLSLAERFLNSAFFRFFIWLIPIALVLIALYNLVRSRGAFTKKNKTDVVADNEDDVQNTIHDYLALSREASNAGDYRPAVKYLFLRTLQQLAAAGLINYARDKTNYNYVQEMSTDKKRDFARLVLNYEYVWYGNSIPEKAMFTEIENQFTTFLKKHNLA